MGNITSNALRRLRARDQLRIVMLGLDSAGKTTILHSLRLGKVVTTTPTMGFNVETVELRGKQLVSLTTLSVGGGGQGQVSPPVAHLYANVNAIVFVVDCNDRERAEHARSELDKVLEEEELMGAPLLVFANKQDLPTVMKTRELVDKLDLTAIRGRFWFVQECCAVKGAGLFEGLEWLSATLKRIKNDHEDALPANHNHLEDLSVEAKSSAIIRKRRVRISCRHGIHGTHGFRLL